MPLDAITYESYLKNFACLDQVLFIDEKMYLMDKTKLIVYKIYYSGMWDLIGLQEDLI